jgi:putative MATE family efflux protein
VNAPARPQQAVFVTGSTLRHVLVMSATGSVGLMAIFLVDFLSLFYIARLGDPAATAGVGYATLVLFLAVSVNVGLMIAVSALVGRSLGAGAREEARAMAGSALAAMAGVALLVSVAALPFLRPLLSAIGAHDASLEIAHRFLLIALPSNALMALGMGFSGILRAVGDARRAMWVTLSGAIVVAALDPLLIFGLGLGPDGAAIATVVSRLIFALVGFHGAARVHRLVARPRLAQIARDARPMLAIAGPAILTNLATPIANAVFASVLARYGDKAVAAGAIVDRLVPVAFGGIFALSGAIGPILAQNWGAGRYDRMRAALRDALLVTIVYVLVIWAGLALGRDGLVAAFGVTGLTAELVAFFCLISGLFWLFNGTLFVANAAFNNLGFAYYSTLFNWGRATLGTIPVAMIGAALGGPKGAFLAISLGVIPFGIAACVTAFRAIGKLEARGVAK